MGQMLSKLLRRMEATFRHYRFCRFDEKFFDNYTGGSSLDLGCGPTPRNPFHASTLAGIDLHKNEQLNIYSVDLTIEPMPFQNDTFDYVTAFDFIEHVPRVIYVPTRRFPFIELMNEVYRVLAPGGLFLSFTPAVPSSEAYQDPTHVNFITEETFTRYFDDKHSLGSIYGFNGKFQVIQQGWTGGHLVSVLKKC